jgi:[protein-PII] uridylyltransferase
VVDDKFFINDKLNLLRIFEEALRSGVLIHPDAMRLISANLDLIDDDMREDREATRIFLDLMLKHGNPERALAAHERVGRPVGLPARVRADRGHDAVQRLSSLHG